MANALIEPSALTLPLVDGFDLDDMHRRILRPDELMLDRYGRARRLPRFFFEVDSWQTALTTRLTEHFELWDFMGVDVREAQPLRIFPRYVPCAVTLLAAQLEVFRQAVNTYVRIAANGGYRSPGHKLNKHASTHCWASAVNIYSIGDDFLDSEDTIDRYSKLVARLLPGAWVRPYGHEIGMADDHLHIDMGYVLVSPHDAPGDRRS
jgi:hypothetical protein